MEIKTKHDYWQIKPTEDSATLYLSSGKELLDMFWKKKVCDQQERSVGWVEDVLLSADDLLPRFLKVAARRHFFKTNRYYYPLANVSAVDSTDVHIRDPKAEVVSHSTFDLTFLRNMSCRLISLSQELKTNEAWPYKDKQIEDIEDADPFWHGMFW